MFIIIKLNGRGLEVSINGSTKSLTLYKLPDEWFVGSDRPTMCARIV